MNRFAAPDHVNYIWVCVFFLRGLESFSANTQTLQGMCTHFESFSIFLYDTLAEKLNSKEILESEWTDVVKQWLLVGCGDI